MQSTLEYNALETVFSGDPMSMPPVSSYTTRDTWIYNTIYFMNHYKVNPPPPFTGEISGVNFNVTNSDFVEGSTEDQHSYRAELGGILNAIETTNQLCRKANITTGSCTLYCDSKGALHAAFGSKRPTPRWTSYDLVQ